MTQTTVLHVDDTQSILELSKSFLNQYDDSIRVLTTTEPTEVIDLIENVDCIVSDYDMPEMNGLELLRRVREERENIPFILFTGKGSEEIASAAIEAGVDGYLRKGSADKYRLLANRIDTLVEKRRAEIERKRGIEAIEAATEAISILDDEGYFVYANDAYAELTGYSRDELIEMHWRELYPSEDAILKVRNGVLPQVMEGGRWLGENEWVRADGERITVDHTLSRSSDGSLICTAKDTTASSNRMEVLEQDDNIIEQSIEQLRDIFFLLDEDGYMQTWNERFEEASEYDASEIAEMHSSDFFTGFDKQTIETVYQRLLEGRDVSVVKADLTTKNGEEKPFEFNPSLLTDGQGEIIGICGTGRPAEHPENLRRQLKENQQALASLYTISTDTTLEFEEKMQHILTLGRDCLGLPTASINRIVDDTLEVAHIQGADFESGVSCPLSESFCRKTVVSDSPVVVKEATEEGWGDDPAYARFNFETYIGAPITVGGTQWGTLCFASDSTARDEYTDFEKTFVELLAQWVGYELEQKQSRRKLESKNERLDEFTRVVSHDLRNPLGVATGRVALARTTGDEFHLDDAEEALERMDDLITHLLDISRNGDWANRPVHLDAGEVAQQAWKHIAIGGDADIEVDSFTLVADRAGLMQMFENLFRNAAEHNDTSALTIRVIDTETGFVVEDTGTGLQNTGGSFEEFVDENDDGGSLGLNIVSSIVEDHGWTISAGESVEGGARFEITTSNE